MLTFIKKETKQEIDTHELQEVDARLLTLLNDELQPLQVEYIKAHDEVKTQTHHVELNEMIMREYEDEAPNNIKDLIEARKGLKDSKERLNAARMALNEVTEKIDDKASASAYSSDELELIEDAKELRDKTDRSIYKQLFELYKEIERIKNNELNELMQLNKLISSVENTQDNINRIQKYKGTYLPPNKDEYSLSSVGLIKSKEVPPVRAF